ncbi:hypothetical protein Pmar_PMAR011109 [Perkinsus marinus ATCC 50983]|uniref:Uncharacterized protein n=1 Tax=Perkinsus marinus (strain ATCC 50983 / TXsc) TaxID=423536 RepID=C5KVQ8_PERM5|nr:hypothetical protein Pmar_PMAR011109 [Perkinsus marinus ATCC 50983]EER11443.1 hypothetical protein Pmar_PMAR011109 [Perkinsus marinus ATCC 50983]|eukprot:XP_002779648.1 hypothetical protein Pmar_PMAR011109 [Perkinsus marinus ATCC 50983]
MIEYELNTLAKDHKLYQLDNSSSIINNIPNPDTIYHGVINHNPYIHINLQLNELKPRLDIQGEETEKTMELLVFPIGGKAAAAAAALFVQIRIISDDGDDVTVRHLIMEPDDDDRDIHNIGREKKGEVGYGVDNLGEWDNKYVVAHY